VLLGAAKVVATSLTVGSGGSAGDFGPSLVMGGLFGGAFGRAAQLLLHDPRIDPGAFALVGMGTFYGGLARVPLAALVMTCELAGSYDLLVPLMLAGAVAFVALRRHAIYTSQVPTRRESPAYRADQVIDALTRVHVGDVVVQGRPHATFGVRTPVREIAHQAAAVAWQDVFPVLDEGGHLVGIVPSEVLRTLAANPDLGAIAIAHDVMLPPVSVRARDTLRQALDAIADSGLREVIVVGDDGHLVGFLGEAEISRAYRESTAF
jgi:CIC family chloride channel protein